MVGNKTVIVAGVGCRRGCSADEIVALVQRAVASAGCAVSALAAPDFRGEEPGLQGAATTLGLTLTLVDHPALAAVQSRCVTRSARVAGATGLSSIAEAAALSVAGPGSVLVLPRIAGASVTCALAQADTP